MTYMSEIIIAETLMQLIIILFAAKTIGILFEKIGQSKVLGELLVGLIIGPSILGLLDINNEIIIFLAEVGVIVLLFEVGVESKLHELVKTGISSVRVALMGVVIPLFLGVIYILTFTGFDIKVAFFIGATLTATSVGLTIRVLSEMDKTQSTEGKIILGAAVIDDIIGLVLLSILVDMASTGKIIPFNIIKIVTLVSAFLGLLVFADKIFEKRIIAIVNKLKVERTFIVTAFIFALLMSYVSLWIGLATIVGAFAAGLVLEREEHREHIREKTHILTQIFAPVFFVMAGAAINIKSILNAEILPLIIALTAIAFIGKFASGLGIFKENASKKVVGMGMLPRGEVGLIFANFGLTNALVGQDLYSALVTVIMITTFIAPPLLKWSVDKQTSALLRSNTTTTLAHTHSHNSQNK